MEKFSKPDQLLLEILVPDSCWQYYHFVCLPSCDFHSAILNNSFLCSGTRLKFGDGFQYALNAKGSTPAEVMGTDYKSTLKPALESFAEDIKKTSMTKLEELIALQQQSSDLAAKIEGKRNILARLESHINEVSAPELETTHRVCHNHLFSFLL